MDARCRADIRHVSGRLLLQNPPDSRTLADAKCSASKTTAPPLALALPVQPTGIARVRLPNGLAIIKESNFINPQRDFLISLQTKTTNGDVDSSRNQLKKEEEDICPRQGLPRELGAYVPTNRRR
mmetsp:Transcript_8996/g.20908  ORF Transcript_8996/g.20908 Transcript_8996/m.20908 type:complete len:125 (-) Transcript_8996:596-970(-)